MCVCEMKILRVEIDFCLSKKSGELNRNGVFIKKLEMYVCEMEIPIERV